MPRYLTLRNPSLSQLRQVIALYDAAGWHGKGDRTARYRAMIKGSHCFVAAACGQQLVAMGRAISDGANDAYIQDMFVLPQWRRKGVASAVLRKLLACLKKDRLRWVGLIAEKNAAPLYRARGFRPMKNFMPMLKK